MGRIALRLSFLALALNPSFGLSWNSLVWLGGQEAEVEKPEIVEVVRWRQPVCVIPSKGVRSCLEDLSNLQKDYEQTNGKEFVEEQKKLDKFINERESKIVEDVFQDSAYLRSTYDLIEQLRPSVEDLVFREDKDNPMSKRTVPLPEKFVQKNPREAKFFTGSSDKPNLIYVTKVLNAPVTATLVAVDCVPDIGIPLCEDDESLKNTKLFEGKPKEEEVDVQKLLEMLAKQQSVVNVIRQMMETSKESRNAVKKLIGVESPETSNLNVDDGPKKLEGLELTEILFEKTNNESDDSNREKRHAKPIVFDKYKDIFFKPANTEPIIVNEPEDVVENPMLHPLLEILQKHYNAFKKPIYDYQKPFDHASFLEWLFPKKSIAKPDFFQNIFQHIQKKKFPSFNDESVPLENEGSESQMSSEKPMNPKDMTEPVDGKSNGRGIITNSE